MHRSRYAGGMALPRDLKGVTVFVACGFAAKYLRGGGNFSVPLQWMLGLRRLGADAVWLELMPATASAEEDQRHIRAFGERMAEHGLAGRWALLHQKTVRDAHELDDMECHGLTRQALLDRLAGPNVLLNLSHSIHPPFIHRFERRIYCDIDPGEIAYWMSRIEMGQSWHHEFWTIGLNRNGADCRLPKTTVPWKTFYPLVDTQLVTRRPLPPHSRFTTVTQWYWLQGMEIDGQYPDLSKQAAFEKYLSLPRRVPEAEMELAVNLNPDDPEIGRLRGLGWKLAVPHEVTATPAAYRDYLVGSLAEFTPCKGVDVLWRSGWFSDRGAAYLATGRPVITEDTGARAYLPAESGVLWVSNADEAEEAVRRVLREGEHLARQARECAVACFDAAQNVEKILRG